MGTAGSTSTATGRDNRGRPNLTALERWAALAVQFLRIRRLQRLFAFIGQHLQTLDRGVLDDLSEVYGGQLRRRTPRTRSEEHNRGGASH